jgi:hypothetical protein
MRLYRENRLDQPFDVTPEEVADAFWRERDPNIGMTLDRALRGWLATEAGGTGGSWDPWNPTEAKAYDDVFRAVLAAWPAETEAIR